MREARTAADVLFHGAGEQTDIGTIGNGGFSEFGQADEGCTLPFCLGQRLNNIFGFPRV